MNIIKFKHSKINNGKQTAFYTPMSREETKTQIDEIFIREDYKKGKIKKDMIIIDCGANIGLASLYFKDWAKEIYALEPSSQFYQALVENVKPYNYIKTFNLGLASMEVEDILTSNQEGTIPVSFWGNGKITEKVKLTTLDKFMEENKIEHVDLFKIDTEGAEYVILPSQGFFKIASKIDYIIGELHYVSEKLIPDFIPLILQEAGFEIQFLPITNMFLTMSFDNGSETKKYQVDKQTMFFAKRKDL